MRIISRGLVILDTSLLILVNIFIMQNIWHLTMHLAVLLGICAVLEIGLLLISVNQSQRHL